MNMRHLSLSLLLTLLVGCSAQPYRDGAPRGYVDVSHIPDAVPKVEPRSKYGNPASYEQFGRTYHTLQSSEGFSERGIASWYGTKFHGRRTSSGEDYNMYAMTAAHKTLPLPTYVEVTNLDNGRQVVVKVNDRGPFHEGRIIDLSYAAAIKLGINKAGTGRVEIRALDPSPPRQLRQAKTQNPPALTVQAIEAPSSQITPVAIDAAPNPDGTVDDNKLYLQVGAFSSLSNAENLRKRLSDVAERPVHVLPNNDPQRPVYRVRIGPLADDIAAQQLASRLLDVGISNSSVVFD